MPVELAKLGVESLDVDHERLEAIVEGLRVIHEKGGLHSEAVELDVGARY